MDDTISDFKRELAALATIRDELKLKAHLARAELRTELDELERRWRLADEQIERAKSHVKQDATVVRRELKGLLLELKAGFENVKRSFHAS
jgi:hypothetical protein